MKINFAVFDTHFDFLQNIFWDLFVLFWKLWSKMRILWSKILREKKFYNEFLELNFPPIPT